MWSERQWQVLQITSFQHKCENSVKFSYRHALNMLKMRIYEYLCSSILYNGSSHYSCWAPKMTKKPQKCTTNAVHDSFDIFQVFQTFMIVCVRKRSTLSCVLIMFLFNVQMKKRKIFSFVFWCTSVIEKEINVVWDLFFSIGCWLDEGRSECKFAVDWEFKWTKGLKKSSIHPDLREVCCLARRYFNQNKK